MGEQKKTSHTFGKHDINRNRLPHTQKRPGKKVIEKKGKCSGKLNIIIFIL